MSDIASSSKTQFSSSYPHPPQIGCAPPFLLDVDSVLSAVRSFFGTADINPTELLTRMSTGSDSEPNVETSLLSNPSDSHGTSTPVSAVCPTCRRVSSVPEDDAEAITTIRESIPQLPVPVHLRMSGTSSLLGTTACPTPVAKSDEDVVWSFKKVGRPARFTGSAPLVYNIFTSRMIGSNSF